jgi:hypothetical protein
MMALRAFLILIVTAFWGVHGAIAVGQRDQHQNAAFTGLYRKGSVNGRSETVRITNGKTYVDVTEQEYRERGYSPPYESLPTRIIQRLPVRIPAPTGEKE